MWVIDNMFIYNVFGRFIGVKRVGGKWLLFNVDLSEQKHSRIYDVIIPDFLTEDEIPQWLSDIYHETACEEYPDVIRIK
ncbi:DUF7661 family protein [Aeromonas enteropelogenes]|uniref:DUF7661 family protein n=2 Tax=Aeromonas enteropelogenes TaxID=29489 RepID=UPI002286B336|nr:hypothetical protein [Aeromonas enteropelogenes]MCZ0753872.1 hypothetical protein [Aeromonas enteropelogenes]